MEGAICGGVMSRSEFLKLEPFTFLGYYMTDDRFEEYKTLIENKEAWAQKEAGRFFNKFAISVI